MFTIDQANERLKRAGSEYVAEWDDPTADFHRHIIDALLDRIEALEARVSELDGKAK